jgi:putative nucleotidyltransferase with HDIG domain
MFAAVSFVAENLAFNLPMAGSISLAFAVNYAAVLLGGGIPAVLVAAAGAVSITDIQQRKSPWIIAFNVAQFLVSVLVGSLLIRLFGVEPIVRWSRVQFDQTTAAAWAAGALGLFLSNVLMVSMGIALARGLRVLEVMRLQRVPSFVPSLLVLALLGVLLALMTSIAGPLSAAILLIPFIVARRTFLVYLELSKAYTETVRSLVTAIEAKDPYTRGHSERVAAYAKRIAAAGSLPPATLDLIEKAALLHDIGKLGVQLRTLTSANRLTAEEVREIRAHPVLGSGLLESVEFLSEVVQIVRHHHERLDGAGYPDGLVASQIPYLSKVLAVADCYDAMTSDRAYRPAMSREEAVEELRRVAGTQLDAHLVDLLIASTEASTADDGDR